MVIGCWLNKVLFILSKNNLHAFHVLHGETLFPFPISIYHPQFTHELSMLAPESPPLDPVQIIW